MTTDSSFGLSLSHFNKYAGTSLGLIVSAISLASINHKQQMIDTLYSCSGQTVAAISSIAGGVIGAWTQNPVAVIGVAAGGFSALQVFSKSSDIARNLGISALASTCLVALAKSSIDPAVPTMCLMCVATGLGVYRHHAYYYELIANAETGNEEAIKELFNSSYLINTATEAVKKRAGKVFISFAKKHYAKGDQISKDEALAILAVCFLRGLHVTQSRNAAMLCMNRANSKEMQEHVVAYNAQWDGPATHDAAIERLIDLYLGIKE